MQHDDETNTCTYMYAQVHSVGVVCKLLRIIVRETSKPRRRKQRNEFVKSSTTRVIKGRNAWHYHVRATSAYARARVCECASACMLMQVCINVYAYECVIIISTACIYVTFPEFSLKLNIFVKTNLTAVVRCQISWYTGDYQKTIKGRYPYAWYVHACTIKVFDNLGFDKIILLCSRAAGPYIIY